MTQGLCDRCWEEPATRIAVDAQGRRLEIGERCKRLHSEGLRFEETPRSTG